MSPFIQVFASALHLYSRKTYLDITKIPLFFNNRNLTKLLPILLGTLLYLKFEKASEKSLGSLSILYFIAHWSSNFDKISIQIIETYNLLSPRVGHQSVYILNIRIKSLKLFYKFFYVSFLKV